MSTVSAQPAVPRGSAPAQPPEVTGAKAPSPARRWTVYVIPALAGEAGSSAACCVQVTATASSDPAGTASAAGVSVPEVAAPTPPEGAQKPAAPAASTARAAAARCGLRRSLIGDRAQPIVYAIATVAPLQPFWLVAVFSIWIDPPLQEPTLVPLGTSAPTATGNPLSW